jgi:hypothetical protein
MFLFFPSHFLSFLFFSSFGRSRAGICATGRKKVDKRRSVVCYPGAKNSKPQRSETWDFLSSSAAAAAAAPLPSPFFGLLPGGGVLQRDTLCHVTSQLPPRFRRREEPGRIFFQVQGLYYRYAVHGGGGKKRVAPRLSQVGLTSSPREVVSWEDASLLYNYQSLVIIRVPSRITVLSSSPPSSHSHKASKGRESGVRGETKTHGKIR